MAAETPPPQDPGALGAGADRIRETVKWLITAFAGVGAALIAGSQLASLGKIDGGRLAFAVVCVVGGLAALAYAIAVAASIMTAGRVSLGDLADATKTELNAVRSRVNGDPALLAGYSDVADMNSEYGTALTQRKTDFDAHYSDVHDAGKALTAQLSDAKALAADQAVQRLLTVASFYTLSDAFNAARPKMFGGALFAALAIVGFAWAAHPPEEKEKKQPAVAAPAVVTLKLSKEAQTLLGATVGKKCAKERLRVVVLATSGGNAEVVTLPSMGCRVARFTVSADMGAIDTGTTPAPTTRTATTTTTTTTTSPTPTTTETTTTPTTTGGG
jgi:hypothetical protein